MRRLIVLIPHYNNYDELVKSILSIKEEIEVDVLVVDDGSENRNRPNEESLSKIYTQGKVFVELLENNRGIEHALNRGLEIIEEKKYDYIGRLDCGDLNHKNKFTKQLAYLNENPDVYLLGTWVNMLDKNNKKLYSLKHPVTYFEIKNKMFLNSTFVHPTVIFRTGIIKKIGYYPTKYPAAEDYAYFFNVLEHFKVENYPEILLDYIVDDESISSKKRKLQVKNRIRVILHHFYFGFYPFYGLARNIPLLFMSRNLTTRLKKILK